MRETKKEADEEFCEEICEEEREKMVHQERERGNTEETSRQLGIGKVKEAPGR